MRNERSPEASLLHSHHHLQRTYMKEDLEQKAPTRSITWDKEIFMQMRNTSDSLKSLQKDSGEYLHKGQL